MRRWFHRTRHARNKDKAFSRFLRMLYYRLIVPIRRARDDPTLIARGVLVGLSLGMTPTVGIQMYLILAVWLLLRPIWNFNVILAIAWSWLSNPFTMVPLYYMFYLTGKVLLLDFDSYFSFAHFADQLNAVLVDDGGDRLQAFIQLASDLWQAFGASILVGCLPFSLGLGVLGYWATFRLVRPREEGDAQRDDST